MSCLRRVELLMAFGMRCRLIDDDGRWRGVSEKVQKDVLVSDPEDRKSGTAVLMGVNNNKARKMSFYFNQCASIEGFYKAMVPVKLLQHKNEGLVPRSQARRLLARVDEFKEVVFVFENIEEIGQPFCRRDLPGLCQESS